MLHDLFKIMIVSVTEMCKFFHLDVYYVSGVGLILGRVRPDIYDNSGHPKQVLFYFWGNSNLN